MLDRDLIVEPNESWPIFNWVRYFTLGGVEAESGFTIDQLVGDFGGAPLNPECDLIGRVASGKSGKTLSKL